ncbi:hypothetical protein AK830_g10601 [Neonectria ditissima]|uniref:Uncharacterized protein n=1 Tax=Neonectria ditissima TaxID=78410 RepID=A0A0P7B3B2_9HYPO|nr:hypothetical protein AK830_g10601 [Neonectria ditissima]
MTSSKDMPPVTAGYLSMFFKNQFFSKLPRTPAETQLRGQTALVTGASSGLGLESARQMLALGLSYLIIAVRSPERGKAAAAQLRAANPSARIDVWPLEMESYQSVQAFAQRCATELARIDIAVLNAGVAEADFCLAASTGHEKTMQVNYLSTVLLVILLLPVLKAKASAGASARITVVNSMMSTFTKFANRDQRPLLGSFDDTKVTPWDPSERYNVSKLLGQLFLSRLADRVAPEDVVINMVEPGLVKGTGLFRNLHGVTGAVLDLLKSASARPVEEGALTYIDAVAVKGRESHGCFIVLCKIHPLATITYKPEMKAVSDQLWEETLDEFRFADARGILESVSNRTTAV